MRASVRLGRSDLISLNSMNCIFLVVASRLTLTFSIGACPLGWAASKAVPRIEMTLTGPSNETVAMTLPAYIGRLKVPSALIATTSLAIPAPRCAATRGRRSLPTAVEVASSRETSFALMSCSNVAA